MWTDNLNDNPNMLYNKMINKVQVATNSKFMS